MNLEEKCVFKKMAEKHPELHPDTKPKDHVLPKECYVCKGYNNSCAHYLCITYSKPAQLSMPAP